MSKLIDQLRNDHAALSAALVQIETLGVATPEGQACLAQTKSALLGHLQKEDAEMYPILWKAAEQDVSLKGKLESYFSNWEQVSQTVMDFFEKYRGEDHGKDFESDFHEVYLALTKRIISEESKLFPEYLRLKSS